MMASRRLMSSLMCLTLTMMVIMMVECRIAVDSSRTSYVAAAVQMSPYWSSSELPAAVVSRNVASYEPLIRQAAQQHADIVVFPEGCNGWMNLDVEGDRNQALPFGDFVPHVQSSPPYLNPCNSFGVDGAHWGAQLHNVSCFAKKHSVTLVVNMIDLQPCSRSIDANCPSDGRYQYNTDVVFSRTGDLIAKYYKNHLSGEAPVLDQPARPPQTHPTVFTTDFGVQFGILICQDMTYADTANMYRKLGVRNVIFSTRWSNQAPMVMSMQLDQSWSIMQQSNIIASNQAVSRRYMGGGIFSNGEPLATFYDPAAKNASTVVVATVPVVPMGTAASQSVAGPRLRAAARTSIHIDDGAHVPIGEENDERPLERSAKRMALATNTSAVCHSWGLEARCTPFSPSLNRTGSVAVSWNDIVCELDYSIANAPLANETWVVLATEFPSNSTHDVDHFYARFCSVMSCPRFPNCVPYYKSPKTSFSAFRLVASGPGFAPTSAASRVRSSAPAPRGGFPMINQTIPQPPADLFWTTVARENGQALNATQYEIVQGGREIRSTKFFTAMRLFSISIGGLNELV